MNNQQSREDVVSEGVLNEIVHDEEWLESRTSYVKEELAGGNPAKKYPEFHVHLQQCPICQEHYPILLEHPDLVEFELEDEEQHIEQWIEDLVHYVYEELHGENPTEKLPEMHSHLQECPICQEQYEELRQLPIPDIDLDQLKAEVQAAK